MQHYRIVHCQKGDILYEGCFSSIAACAEQAVREGVSLDYADLSHANLVNACLDEASLLHARLRSANLAGANLSEARLDGADFTDAGLQNACLCFSSLRHCRFTGSAFGATDVAGGDLSFARFSTLSALTLNFRDAEIIAECVYQEDGAPEVPFSVPPLVLQGLIFPVACFDRHIKIGPAVQSFAEALRYTNDNRPRQRLEDGSVHVFAHNYRHLLRAMIETRPDSERGFY